MEKVKDIIILILCGVVITFGIIILGFNSQELVAQGTSSRNQDMIAVTGTFGSGISALYVIDTRERQLAVYAIEPGGRKLRLIAARKIFYDFKIPEYMDDSEDAVNVENLERDWLKREKAKTK